MNASNTSQRILLFHQVLRQNQDLMPWRAGVRTAAEATGLELLEQARIATAALEFARNALEYTTSAGYAVYLQFNRTPLLRESSRPSSTTALIVEIADRNGELRPLQAAESSDDSGLRSALRLLDQIECEEKGQGLVFSLVQYLPHGRSISVEEARKIAGELSARLPPDPLAELERQNHVLLQALDELQAHRTDLEKINQELGETNRGVVALYDELDTVYRVSRVVAEKLDLDSLLEAIASATVEVCDAEIGAIFFLVAGEDGLTCRALSGILGQKLSVRLVDSVEDLACGQELGADVWHIPDLTEIDRHPLGPDVPIRSYLAIPLRDSEGEIAGVMVFGHHLPAFFTERTERILSSVAVQASIGIENARLFTSVQAANEAKDQFLAILSHELRTPLSPVFTILGSMEGRSDLPQDIAEDVEVMRRNLQLEARLIDDLLDLTRIVKGKVPFHWENVDAHSLIRGALGTSRGEIERKEIDVVLHLDAQNHHVYGDGARLQQVLWNLLSNAVKFSKARGTVEIVSRDAGDMLEIAITDGGMGIAAPAMMKIFEPFVQADTRISHQYGGLGLGLAISRNIVDAHGGSIQASSDGPGRGATFTISLKLATKEESPRSITSAPAPDAGDEPIRILLVDDHEDTRVMYARILKRQGHDVYTASNCADALKLSSSTEFDVLVSDLGLPDGHGHDLMRQMRERGPVKGIALSGYGMENDLERSKDAGFAMHLTKPVEFPTLMEAIRMVSQS